MILMSVSDNYASDLLGICLEVGNVGDDDVDAVHILVREAEAAVYNDYICAEFDGSHVLADLTETAKRDDL